jgi:hypothetical protein
MRGFSLVETMVALFVLTFGLLSAGPMIFSAVASGMLAEAKGTAAVAAQDILESLADLYQANPEAADLALGRHSRQTEVRNPSDGTILNRFEVAWTVAKIPDPRPGKELDARLVQVTVTPILSGGDVNRKSFNKVLHISTVFSTQTR